MPEREGPRVVMRGAAEGDSIILPMGGLQARIIRKASRTETGGHWALGEAWQDPASTTHHTPTTKLKPSMSSKVSTPSTPTPIPQKESGQAPSSSCPPGAVHGFRTGPEGGRLLCLWPSTVEAAFFGVMADSGTHLRTVVEAS